MPPSVDTAAPRAPGRPSQSGPRFLGGKGQAGPCRAPAHGERARERAFKVMTLSYYLEMSSGSHRGGHSGRGGAPKRTGLPRALPRALVQGRTATAPRPGCETLEADLGTAMRDEPLPGGEGKRAEGEPAAGRGCAHPDLRSWRRASG